MSFDGTMKEVKKGLGSKTEVNNALYFGDKRRKKCRKTLNV